GLSYKKMINKDLELVTGFAYTPESKITSENNRSFSTISVASDVESVFNTIDFDLDGIGLKQTDLILPSRFSIGAGVGKPRKWFAGLELASQKTSRFSNDLYSGITTQYEDSYSYSFGRFYIPQYNSFGYLKRIVYRGGFRYEQTGLNINNQSINEFG